MKLASHFFLVRLWEWAWRWAAGAGAEVAGLASADVTWARAWSHICGDCASHEFCSATRCFVRRRVSAGRMKALPNELCLKVVSRVATVEDLVNLRQVSRLWRGMVDDRFGKWLRTRVGEQLPLFSRRELVWVRRYLDGRFCSVVGWKATFELTGCCGSVGTGAGVGYVRGFSRR